jgi:hypothetical protein
MSTFTVSNTNDSGAGSLRDAINQANANPGADTIVFSLAANSATLTGGSGADTFHASAGMGADVVTDFSFTGGDRVQVDAGLTWTVSGSVVTFSDGSTLTLTGVSAGSLPAGWIFSL